MLDLVLAVLVIGLAGVVVLLAAITFALRVAWNWGMGDLDGNWGCGHEIILYCKRGRKPLPKRRGAVLGFHKTPPAHAIHPTEKPVGLLSELLAMSGKAGDTVLDLFSGSGSTSVAAKSLGMNSWGFELDSDHHRRSRV